MGEKRHFEPAKRAEPRFPENPTNHSSPPARRRQKIAPPPSFIPTLPLFSPAPPSSDLVRSLRLPHTLTILPRPPLSCRHRSDNVKHHHPPFKPVHIPRPFILCPTHGAALPYTTPIPFIPLSCGSATTTHFTRGLVKHPNGTISTLFPPPKHFSPHSLPSFSATSATLPVCRATLPKPSLPLVLSPPHIEGASNVSLCKRLLSPSSRATMIFQPQRARRQNRLCASLLPHREPTLSLHMPPQPHAGIIMTQIRRAQPRLGVSHM